MPRLLGISILHVRNQWVCLISVETPEGIKDYEAWASTPGEAATEALQLGGIL